MAKLGERETPDRIDHLRRATQARQAAVRRLIEQHEPEYRQLHVEERQARGLPAEYGQAAQATYWKKRAAQLEALLRDQGIDPAV